jgi:hypothetical protein
MTTYRRRFSACAVIAALFLALIAGGCSSKSHQQQLGPGTPVGASTWSGQGPTTLAPGKSAK